MPSLRGRGSEPQPTDILAEVRSLADRGVLEVTLLGQNVNAYGVSFADRDIARDRGAFASLLRECGRIDGLERVRFTSPHPAEFTDDVIGAMAPDATSARTCICPCSPVPTASCARCAAPTGLRSTSASLDRVRTAMPHAAITTDIIVGFPARPKGLRRHPRRGAPGSFLGGFTFQYSRRPGTPADLDGQAPEKMLSRSVIND